MPLPPELYELIADLEPEEIAQIAEGLPPEAVQRLMEQIGTTASAHQLASPLDQALHVDAGYCERPHLTHVSEVISDAVRDVEGGQSRRLIFAMPPRSGKSTLTTQHAPAWALRQHPDWPLALVSHDASLATSWGRQIRRWVEDGMVGDVEIAPDAGAVSEWQTTDGGGVLSRSTRGSMTGRGAKVMLIDDPHKDFVEAHSSLERQRVWDWWLTVAQTRLEPPSLVIVVMTRWHADDLVGRLLSREHEGDPDDWTVVLLPAIAEENDALGRAPGEPLLSPLLNETPEEAVQRWENVKREVGSYAWNALYQQRPSPPEGAIFHTDWWRYWTRNPSRAANSDNTVLFDPDSPATLNGGTWVESWDMAFKATDSSDYVVGQRWVRVGPDRFLTDQRRGRFTFTQTIEAMRSFSASHVHIRLVEDKANGTAVIDTLRRDVGGIIAVSPRDPKEARARAVSPEVESGNVYLPHPGDPGNGWVADLLDEVREFPKGAHDDQVDAMTQALNRLRRHVSALPSGSPARTAVQMPSRAMTRANTRRITR